MTIARVNKYLLCSLLSAPAPNRDPSLNHKFERGVHFTQPFTKKEIWKISSLVGIHESCI